MQPTRITVLLPCHSLEDFPSWLDGEEARDLLDAWTAAWHPFLIAATGRLPEAGSLDQHADAPEATLFVVPASFDDRLSVTGLDALGTARLVRQIRGREAIVEAAIGLVRSGGAAEPAADRPAPCPHADDFHALGLAWLLADVLARRMRSTLAIDEEAFRAAAVAAAEAALAGRCDEVREKLTECFETLASSRKRYYPVDIWLLDLVLLAGSTLGDPLGVELQRPGLRTLIATGELIERLAASRPDLASVLRERLAAGTLASATGLYDDTAIHRLSTDAIVDSLRRCRDAWHTHTGHRPTTFARRTGGLAAILPKLLSSSGFTAAIYRLFDGSRLPDPGSSRLRWESPSGESIEAVSCPPVDARSPNAAMTLADAIGDMLDHSHTAILTFAHYPGTADRWYDDFRRIAGWSDCFGRFVLPEEVIRETAGTGVRADFQPDSFPGPAPLASDFDPQPDAAAQPLAGRLLSSPLTGNAVAPVTRAAPRGGLLGRFLGSAAVPRRGSSSRRDATPRLDNGLVSLRIHAETGGMLAFRGSGDGPNRLSQQLAVRTTPPLAVGSRWEDPLDRAEYSRMVADAIKETSGPGGEPAVESRGRLVDEKRLFGTFRQKVWLEPSLPIARFEIAIDLASPLPVASDVAEWFHACVVSRFAWNENEDVELFRSLNWEASATERAVFFAKHFVELRGTGCTILTGGLPWHSRSGPHMLDTILLPSAYPTVAAPSRKPEPHAELKITRHLAIGLGLDSPLEAALALAGQEPQARDALKESDA